MTRFKKKPSNYKDGSFLLNYKINYLDISLSF